MSVKLGGHGSSRENAQQYREGASQARSLKVASRCSF